MRIRTSKQTLLIEPNGPMVTLVPQGKHGITFNTFWRARNAVATQERMTSGTGHGDELIIKRIHGNFAVMKRVGVNAEPAPLTFELLEFALTAALEHIELTENLSTEVTFDGLIEQIQKDLPL